MDFFHSLLWAGNDRKLQIHPQSLVLCSQFLSMQSNVLSETNLFVHLENLKRKPSQKLRTSHFDPMSHFLGAWSRKNFRQRETKQSRFDEIFLRISERKKTEMLSIFPCVLTEQWKNKSEKEVWAERWLLWPLSLPGIWFIFSWSKQQWHSCCTRWESFLVQETFVETSAISWYQSQLNL